MLRNNEDKQQKCFKFSKSIKQLVSEFFIEII